MCIVQTVQIKSKFLSYYILVQGVSLVVLHNPVVAELVVEVLVAVVAEVQDNLVVVELVWL